MHTRILIFVPYRLRLLYDLLLWYQLFIAKFYHHRALDFQSTLFVIHLALFLALANVLLQILGRSLN